MNPVSSVMTDTLTITDNRTGKQYDIPIKQGAIKATDLRQIKIGEDDAGLMTYDPAFMNTAACRSAITYIDGDKGISLPCYPIEELAGVIVSRDATDLFASCRPIARSLDYRIPPHDASRTSRI